MSAKKKAAGAAFLSRGWSSQGPRPRANVGGAKPSGTIRKHRSEEHRALTRFQLCFVRRGNGFVGRLGSGVWCGRNSNASRIKVPPFHRTFAAGICIKNSRVGGWRVPTQFPTVRGTIFAHFSLRSRRSKGGAPSRQEGATAEKAVPFSLGPPFDRRPQNHRESGLRLRR